jgi:SAM-dependent methyltransferase
MRKDDDQIAQDWEADWKRAQDIYFWHTRLHYQMVVPYLHGTVLDVGCGPGFLAAWTFPNETFYTGVDYSAAALDLGRKLFPGAHFHAVDVTKQRLPFGDSSFDTVVCSETLEHLADFHPVLPELKRVSRQYIVITVPISMGNCGHVYPVWSCEDVHREFGSLGKILEVRHNYEAHSHLVWIKK